MSQISCEIIEHALQGRNCFAMDQSERAKRVVQSTAQERLRLAVDVDQGEAAGKDYAKSAGDPFDISRGTSRCDNIADQVLHCEVILRIHEEDVTAHEVSIPPLGLGGTLNVPARARGMIVFAHGSGSSRFSPRNIAVAAILNRFGFATLLLDLLTADEEHDRQNVFDIRLLAKRLISAIDWTRSDPDLSRLPLGLFGASTGAAAALMTAARRGDGIGAVVSRGGRPDLVGSALRHVRSPTLLIVGGDDHVVLELNKEALTKLRCERLLQIVPGATHLFSEPGGLEAVSQFAVEWFCAKLCNAGAVISRRKLERLESCRSATVPRRGAA